MHISVQNIYSRLPERLPAEIFETLLQQENIRIERIVSAGQTTADGEWYDQEWDEWVLVLQGNATVLFANEQLFHFKSGDYLFIPAHTRHRVQWTDPDIKTIWLAVHIAKS